MSCVSMSSRQASSIVALGRMIKAVAVFKHSLTSLPVTVPQHRKKPQLVWKLCIIMVSESHQIYQTNLISTYVTLCIGQLLLEHKNFQSFSVYTFGKMNNELGWEHGKQNKGLGFTQGFHSFSESSPGTQEHCLLLLTLITKLLSAVLVQTRL